MLKLILRSFRKSLLMKSAGKQALGGDITGAAVRIYAFMVEDAVFSQVIRAFAVDRLAIEEAILGLRMQFGHRLYQGHYVPVSAMLFVDTFAYSMRVRTGQVSNAEWLVNIGNYFESGARTFEPERAFHTR
jgi:hypothetical protein